MTPLSGENIRSWRLRLGLTEEQVAAGAGVSVEVLRQVEATHDDSDGLLPTYRVTVARFLQREIQGRREAMGGAISTPGSVDASQVTEVIASLVRPRSGLRVRRMAGALVLCALSLLGYRAAMEAALVGPVVLFAPEEAPDPIRVRVLALRTAKVKLVVDGGEQEVVEIPGGRDAIWRADDTISLHVEDISAFKFWFNESSLQPTGRLGRPRTLTFVQDQGSRR